MLRSLLNALGFGSLILDIFVILAVVVAGSLIFYFVWEAISLAIKKNESKKKSNDIDFDVVDDRGMQNFDLERQKYLADVKQETAEEQQSDESQDEIVKAEEIAADAEPVEGNVAESQPQVFNEEALEDVDDDKAEAEKQEIEAQASREEQENAERRAYLEERRQELLRRLQEDDEEEEEEEEPAQETEQEEDGDDGRFYKEDETQEVEEEPEEYSDDVAEETEKAEETEEESETDALQEERDALAAEKAKYEAMVHELENARRALAESQAAAAVAPAPKAPASSNEVAIEELKEKLANAEERLAETEKEFKQCKKEYIPLKKVWETHEKDEKKLRRKEALVAKQKVLLYGVNNYADIDEEKAKKLAEDLDLLDGLKLSVQHCEEVMKNNEERYPLLEKMYNVLKFRDDEIRKDIEFYKAEIARLENEE